MVQVFLAVLGALRVFFRSRSDTALEILALRQQVAVLKRQRPRRPLNSGDPLLLDHPPPLLVPPDRCPPDCPTGDRRRLASAGCRLYWRWRSRGGRPSVTQELRDLIARLAEENPDWGAPKIHGELQKLGFTIAERTVARYLRRILHRGDPKRKWLAFLQNHREVIAAMDFLPCRP